MDQGDNTPNRSGGGATIGDPTGDLPETAGPPTEIEVQITDERPGLTG